MEHITDSICSLCEQGRNVEVTPAIKEHVQSKGPHIIWSSAHFVLSFASVHDCIPVVSRVTCLFTANKRVP